LCTRRSCVLPDVTIRDATRADAAAIADLLNAHSLALFGELDLTAATVESWFELPRVVWFGIAERGEEIVGYADVQQSEERADVDARVVADAAALPLLQSCVENARPDAPVWGYASSTDEAVALAYRALEFTVIRHSFTMRIELTDESAAPEWPADIEVLPWRDGDDPAFHAALQETFADHFGFSATAYGEWLHSIDAQPHTDRSLWYLARAGDEVAAVAQCSWHDSGDRTFGVVHELGVCSPWRRRGLGLALLRHLFAEFRARGATRVGLGVDAENTSGAVRLYERAGMSQVRRNDTWELDVSGRGQ